MAEMFSALSAVFLFGRAFVCFCARLAVHYLAVYSVLGSLIKQSLTATKTSTKVVKVCVIIICPFLCVVLHSREIRRLNIKSFLSRHCCRWCLTCYLLLGQRVSACTFDHL